MFSRPERLTKKKVFDTIFKRGHRIRGKWFSLVTLPQSGQGKIGFIVTKKTLRASTARNRAKRRVRGAFRSIFHKGEFQPIKQHNTIIVLLHQSVDDISFAELTSEIERRLKQIPNKKSAASGHVKQ